MTIPRRASLPSVVGIVVLLVAAAPARATPLDFIPVGDPLEDELRALEIAGHAPTLPHLGMRPLQIMELPDYADSQDPAVALTLARVRRALARDRSFAEPVPGSTPRLLQMARGEDQRFEISLGLEGRGTATEARDPFLDSGSGIHMRFAAQAGGWLGFSHVMIAEVEDLQHAETVFPNSQMVLHSEESYLAYHGDSSSWAVQLGRSRWHWGPGYEGTLLLSRTSAPLDGAGARFRIAPLRADAMVFSSTLESRAGERLAAHRLEWQPWDPLRIGVHEAVRYQSDGPEPLYVIGLLPYTVVQNILVQQEPDSFDVLRNNVIAGFDVAWRFARGSRFYGELLIDDLRTDNSTAVNKLAWQVGLEGVGTVRDQRLTWGVEYTRLSRFVYTSFFGRTFESLDQPIGFPTGPDARRVTARGTWDPAVDWQVFARAARTDIGESGIDVPYVPGSPSVPTLEFAGVVEQAHAGEIGLRWWPATGIDVALSVGYERIEQAGHVPGLTQDDTRGSLSVRLIR